MRSSHVPEARFKKTPKSHHVCLHVGYIFTSKRPMLKVCNSVGDPQRIRLPITDQVRFLSFFSLSF